MRRAPGPHRLHAQVASFLAAAGLTLAACSTGAPTPGASGTASTPDKPVEITFSYLWGSNEAKKIESLITKFNSSQKRIVVKGVSNPDTAAQLASMTGSSGQFDISDHFCNGVNGWSDLGLLEPLTPFIEKDKYDLSDFMADSMEPVTVKNVVYSMPIVMYTFQLVYNKTLLDQAGVTPPKTWAEFLEAGKKLTVVKDGKVERLGFAPLDLTMATIALGGDWAKDGKPNVDVEKVTAAARLFLSQTDGVDPGAIKAFRGSFGDYWSAENPFYAGKVAMTIDGPWHVQMIPTFKPTLQWGAAPLPAPSAGAAPIGQSACSTLFIPKNAKHKAEAWEFMKYMLAPENMANFAQLLSNMPTRKSLSSDPLLVGMGPQYKVWLDAMNNQTRKGFPSAPWASKFVTDIGEAAEAINNRTSSVEDAVAKLADKAKGY